MRTLTLSIAFGLIAGAAAADDPPKKLTPAGRKELEAKWNQLTADATGAYRSGLYTDATLKFEGALQAARRLYPADTFPNGHVNYSISLNNLALVHRAQGHYAAAENLYEESLAMQGRLAAGDHVVTARIMNNLAFVYRGQGLLAKAEPLLKDSLEMNRRLFPGDSMEVAGSLQQLGALYMDQGKYADAGPLLTGALEMTKRLAIGDHSAVASLMKDLGNLYFYQNEYAAAEAMYKDALGMCKRIFPPSHPAHAEVLNNWAFIDRAQGKQSEAEARFRDILEMTKRQFKDDHPVLSRATGNLAGACLEQGKLAEAEQLFVTALEMNRRFTSTFARQKSEGESLTLHAMQSGSNDGLFTITRMYASSRGTSYNPENPYSTAWFYKGAVARVFEQRQLRARAAAADPVLAKTLAELTDARRRRAELMVAPAARDPEALKRREADLRDYDATVARLDRELADRLPSVARIAKLETATLGDLRKALPADAALVDYYRYAFCEWDDSKPVGKKESRTPRYLAFVVTRDRVAWVDLDTAANIEPAVAHWREAITTPNAAVSAGLPGRVRELVWDKVRARLPASVKTVYICPDAALCRVPWAALPGDKPGTVLLEDFALATVPHAPFLLDKLWPQDPLKNPPAGVLAVGGVNYDARPAATATRGKASPGLLVKADAKIGWDFLPATAVEARGVAALAERKRFPAERLDGVKATAVAVLAALPKARYAHLATHGFFADPSFRGLFQLDEKDYETSRRGERIGRAVNSPLVMTGLVFAGANDATTPGRGVVTGESLIDLDLSGLELAVLSACETGLGDVAGGEGTFGLQRAFHLSGTRDVVASLWKVPDAATAALMGEFYKALWEENQPPAEALRRAQLAVYRADPEQFKAMALRGPGFGDKNFDAAKTIAQVKVNAGGKNSPLLWAAFTLSGPGR